MALEKMDNYFNSVVESYDERIRRSVDDADGYIVRTADFFPKDENLQIIDIGSGTGLGLSKILEQNKTVRVTCVDCAAKMLQQLRVNLKVYGDRVQTVTEDFFAHDFGFEFYDGALSMMALHYYSREEKLELFKRIRGGLKKGGFLVLTDKFAPTQNYEDFCRSEFERKKNEAHLPDAHYYAFTPQTISNEAALLFKAGFSEVRLRWAKSNTAVLFATK